jgi:two-component system alkaline phosphatase synthesis response regulator PhoP
MRDKKVLIIDPDFETVKSLHQFLTDLKYQVIVAYDCEQGLSKVKTENPDLVILEAMLPKLTGFDLCTIIYKDLEKNIPVIIISEFYQDFKDVILQKCGATALLKKPVDKEELHYTLFDLFKKNTENNNSDKPQSRNAFLSSFNLESQSGSGNNGKDRKKKSEVEALLKDVLSEFDLEQEKKRPSLRKYRYGIAY